jgi:hypothetical protein
MGGGEFRLASSEPVEGTAATLSERRGKGQVPFPAMREVGEALTEVSKNNSVLARDEAPKVFDEFGREKVGAAHEVGGKATEVGTQTTTLHQYVYPLELTIAFLNSYLAEILTTQRRRKHIGTWI